MKSFALLTALFTLLVATGCDTEAMRKDRQAKRDHETYIEQLRHQNQMAEIDRVENWRLHQQQQKDEALLARQKQAALDEIALTETMNAHRLRAAVEWIKGFRDIAIYALPFIIGLIGLFFLLRMISGIVFRHIDAKEVAARETAKYNAIAQAIDMVPEDERAALIHKWIDGDPPPAVGHAG